MVDGKGLKMSKSAGNVISPEDILKNYGADILRAWVASSDYSEDIRIDKIILEQHAESYRKIRNTFRFILGNIKDNFQQENLDKVELDDFEELEKYILHKLFELNEIFRENQKNYNFNKLYKELLNFCTLDLSSFYFDIRKDVLYCDSINSKKRKNCIKVLNIILDCLLKWFAPILVFTTEEIHNLICKDSKSIHETTFPKIPGSFKNSKLNEKWSELFKIKQQVNISIEKMRASKEIGSSLEADLKISTTQKNFDLFKDIDVAEYFITSKAEIIKNENDQLKIDVKKSKGYKCPRCWKILETKCNRCEKINSQNI